MKSYSNKAKELFYALLRSTVSTGEEVQLPESEELYNEILSIARDQDLLYLICYGIKKNGGKLSVQLNQTFAKALYQHTQNDYMLKKAKKAFNSEKIPHIALKGAVIRDYYPEPWMRTCCDIDILIQEKDLQRAVQSLVKSGFTTDNIMEYHDISLYYGVSHLELHFNICENIPRIDSVLNQVWKHTELKSDYEYIESNEFYAFHIIAHMLYHFLKGGCSIKQLTDLWLLRYNSTYDERKIQPFLSSCKLEQFYQVICNMIDEIFMHKEQTELSKTIEKHFFSGGLRYRESHTDNIDIIVSGGIKKYIVNSIFLPRREMEWIYPSLRKYPILLPLYYGKRALSKSFGKERERAKAILKATHNIPNETEDLLNRMGLS